MLVTEPAWFKVVGRQNGNLWLQVQTGQDQGRRVSVPVVHEEYDPDLTGQLRSLSVGDQCKVTLQSNSETAPDWRVVDILEVDESVQNSSARNLTSIGLSD